MMLSWPNSSKSQGNHFQIGINSSDDVNHLNSHFREFWSTSSDDSDCNVSESNSNNRVWSDSETEVMKYVASNKKKSKYKIRRFILGSTSGNDSDSSCGSSTITDDSCTITGDTSQDECGVFDDWPILLQELSPSTDDSSSENIKKKRRKLVNHLVACRVCGGPELICNFICVCVACNEGYHQKCHDPQISHFKIGEKWRCIDCQNALRNKSSLIFKKSINRVMNDSMSTTHIIKENGNIGSSYIDQQIVDHYEDSTITSMSTKVNGKNLYDINSSNDDDSIQKSRTTDFYQQRTANKCLNGYNHNIKKDRKDVDNKGLDKDSSLPYPITKTNTSPKKRNRSLLPLILPPSEKRHSTTTELRRLFDNCPMSIVNFDEVFKPEEWSKHDDIASSSRNSSSSENKSLISLRKKSVVNDKSGTVILNKSTSSPGKSAVISNKSASSPGKNPVSIKSVTSSSIRHVTSKRSTSIGKKAITSISKRYDPSNTSDVSHNEPDSTQDLISSNVFSPPIEKSLSNVKAVTKSFEALTPKNGISSSKSTGIAENDTNFNITSLLPLNLIPCLNFDALAFREGTIDIKRGQVKRGKVYPVLR
ncbi:lsd1/2 complex phd finger containing protein phf2 [Gigaspora margarita]|uniref:Lsd1/2 complex phd finger containing protein phf2 n=1 Tax=Gigaspora margarita TaxID=4874 RepID=A0A8H4ATE0_GIGMA|nr:lsd1/2 complex phd finger containing protein phf2 [Gigaspora margarita]